MEAFVAPYISLSICQLVVESENDQDTCHSMTCRLVKGKYDGEGCCWLCCTDL